MMRRFKDIDFSAKRGHLVADASDLEVPPGVVLQEFEMESIGQIAHFKLVNHQLDIDGDVMRWDYESNHLPGRVGKMTASIYND